MPYYRVDGLMVHLNLGGKLRKNPPAPCCAPIKVGERNERCMGMSSFLCDWKCEDGPTCDAPLCPEHATEVGKDRHYCPRHLAQQRQPELI
jgi:hypothetical protein